MALSRNPSAVRDRCCHPPPLLAAQTVWQKFTSQDASQLKALFPWQAPYSPSCSLIYELCAGGSRHQRLSLCTTNPHLLYRSVWSKQSLLSRRRWLAMDHSQCDVCNCGMPDGQVFHWDTPVNMLTQKKRNSPNSPPQIELLEEKKMNCLREMTGREAKVMLEPGPHGESCSLPACAGLSFSIS